jgi:hypothetical protein
MDVITEASNHKQRMIFSKLVDKHCFNWSDIIRVGDHNIFKLFFVAKPRPH